MNIGRSVAPENWDQKRAMSKGRSRRDLELNKYIEVVKARFLEIHNMLVREGKMVNPKILLSASRSATVRLKRLPRKGSSVAHLFAMAYCITFLR